MVVCVYMPRFELNVALAGKAPSGPLAIAPAPGEAQRVGEVSRAAEAHGVVAEMSLGEALARCPSLGLLPADPLGVADTWEAVLEGLEGIGAAVEAERAGIAFFEADGLLGIHGSLDRLAGAARRACLHATGMAERTAGGETAGGETAGGGTAGGGTAGGGTAGVRIGVGGVRFCALVAALTAEPLEISTVEPAISTAGSLAAQPVETLRFRAQTAALVEPLERLGVRTLGQLRDIGRGALADRFGVAGVMAHRLACGEDTPLVPRAVPMRMEESMELEEASSGSMLERVLEVMIERLLARREREGRTLRAATLSARLVEGGTWRRRVVFRRPTADVSRVRLALCGRLAEMPAPAETLRLGAESFASAGGPSMGQGLLEGEDGGWEGGGQPRDEGGRRAERAELQDAIGQARTAAGRDAVLRVVLVEEDSSLPERRAVLAPRGE